MDEVKLIQVILCTKKRRGTGTHPSPVRIITEVFTPEGELIAEYDPQGGYTLEQMLEFGHRCQENFNNRMKIVKNMVASELKGYQITEEQLSGFMKDIMKTVPANAIVDHSPASDTHSYGLNKDGKIMGIFPTEWFKLKLPEKR